MKSKFIEKYDKLKDMNIGDVAVSSDRERLFICAYGLACYADGAVKRTEKVIIDLNNLHEQYLDNKLNLDIRGLEKGDKFIFEI